MWAKTFALTALWKHPKHVEQFLYNRLWSLVFPGEASSHTEGEVLIKCTGCSNLLTPWQGALQGTLAYQCRGWWTSLGTHQSEPHWFGTRHFQSSASISSWKASLKPDRGSWLYLSGRAWKSCQTRASMKYMKTRYIRSNITTYTHAYIMQNRWKQQHIITVIIINLSYQTLI